MKMFLTVAITVASSLFMPQAVSQSNGKSKATYVGGGRYVCHDNTAECAMVKQNNRILSKMEREARKPKPYVAPDPTFSGRGQRYSAPEQGQREPNRLTPKVQLTR